MLHKGKPPEGVTLEGARRHAQLIRAYWQRRLGVDVDVRVVEVGLGFFGLRSDMISGMPQRVR